MDGTGALFQWFARLLPERVNVLVVGYPTDVRMSYETLARWVHSQLPRNQPHVIIAESYSGPVAIHLAAERPSGLRAVVLVSSFVHRPCGRIGSLVAQFISPALFDSLAPDWALKWLLADSTAPHDVLPTLKKTIARVKPEVLAARLKDALTVDVRDLLTRSTVRVVCFAAKADRILGHRSSRTFSLTLPRIEVVMIDGPHLLLQCAPEDCVDALTKMGILNPETSRQSLR
jgi:pimeloyl-ACP methyl ester carboxylesterase